MTDGHARWEGALYDRSRDVADIAKDVRAEIKALKRDGILPRRLKVSVRISRFAGGRSIDVAVVNFAEVMGFGPVATFPDEADRFGRAPYRMVAAARILHDLLTALLDRYRMDDSDIQTDYFCTNFYREVTIRR